MIYTYLIWEVSNTNVKIWQICLQYISDNDMKFHGICPVIKINQTHCLYLWSELGSSGGNECNFFRPNLWDMKILHMLKENRVSFLSFFVIFEIGALTLDRKMFPGGWFVTSTSKAKYLWLCPPLRNPECTLLLVTWYRKKKVKLFFSQTIQGRVKVWSPVAYWASKFQF